MKRGSKIISVDPRHTWLTTRAKVHLQLRPGTGGALALGMLNVIINEGIYDKPFVAQWTNGFDKLRERVQEYPPDKVARITEVPQEQIVEAARFYAANKPAAIHWGVAVDMEPESVSVSQAITHLWCITGNVDIPGSNVIARPSHGVTTYPYTTEELLYLYGEDLVKTLNEKRIGADKYPMLKGFRGWAHPDMAIEQIDTGKPYPVKAAWIQTANILGGQAARARYHYDALKKLDFRRRRRPFSQSHHHGAGRYCPPCRHLCGERQLPLLVGAVERHPEGDPGRGMQIGLGDQFRDGRRLNPRGLKWNNVIELINDRLLCANKTFQGLVDQGLLGNAP